jgi:hypothetical protein
MGVLHYMRKCKELKLAVRLGSVFDTASCIPDTLVQIMIMMMVVVMMMMITITVSLLH